MLLVVGSRQHMNSDSYSPAQQHIDALNEGAHLSISVTLLRTISCSQGLELEKAAWCCHLQKLHSLSCILDLRRGTSYPSGYSHTQVCIYAISSKMTAHENSSNSIAK